MISMFSNDIPHAVSPGQSRDVQAERRRPTGRGFRQDERTLQRSDLTRLVPQFVRRRARSLLGYPDTLRLVGDRRSFWRFRQLEDHYRHWNAGEMLELSFREFAGHPVWVRPGTADQYLARDVFFKRHHLPPAELDPGAVGLIWDLGANIGFTMVHMAALYPNARIVGVELDEANAALCAANTASFEGRCAVIRAAIWPVDGEVRYRSDEGDEQGFHVAREPSAHDAAGWTSAPAMSLNTLLRTSGTDRVEYIKMDIEGAEAAVLQQNTQWASAVRTIKVEVHPPYSVAECERDLQGLGFRTRQLRKRRGGVAGIKGGS
jgi:FkbM family methyltransferase